MRPQTSLALTLALIAGTTGPALAATSDPSVEVAVSLNDEISAVVPGPDGRLFLTLPRVGVNHTGPSVVEMVNGKAVPFPDDTWASGAAGRPLAEWFVSPLGMVLQGKTLWVLDEGKRAGIDGIADGAAKLVGVDIDTRRITRTIVFAKPFLRDTMQLNDVRIDPTHGTAGTAYISNNGFSKPDASLVIVDIASGRMREILKNAPEVSPAPGFMTFVDGQPHAYSTTHATMPQGGVNGIALSPDHSKLVWTTPTSPNYYSLPTAVLADFSKSDGAITQSIRFEGQTASSGGIRFDASGSLIFGDGSRHAIIGKHPDGTFFLLAHDARFSWPDGLAAADGWIYVSIGQWQKAPSFNGGIDKRSPPYLVLRVRQAP